MRYYFFLHYVCFFQNLEKEAVWTFMHTTVCCCLVSVIKCQEGGCFWIFFKQFFVFFWKHIIDVSCLGKVNKACFKGFLSRKANLMSFLIKKWILKTLFLPKSLWNKPFAESLKNYDHGFNLNWFLSNSVNMIKNLPMTHAFMSELCHMALALVFQLGFPFTVSDIWYVPW